MDRTVYFSDKAVLFTGVAPGGECIVVGHCADDPISRTKVSKILETHNSVAVVSDDPDAAFEAFAAGFTRVEAAGGVVVDACGRRLMIRRNGRWDLPKGHVECAECVEACAVREVEEETGVASRVVRPLCRTLHAYWFPKTGRWELKRTHWYELRAEGCEGLKPQAEEGIECAAWCTPDEFREHLQDAFPTIRCVASALDGE